MAIVGDTGNGATFVLATTGGSFAIEKISVGEESVNLLDASVLATTDYMLTISAALKTTPELVIDVVFATGAALPNPGSAPETGTLTFPTRSGESTAANIAGTGFVSARKYPDMANSEIQKAQFKFKYDGDTGPTFTAST